MKISFLLGASTIYLWEMRRMDNWNPYGVGPRQFGSIVPGVFAPVLAKHSKSFSLVLSQVKSPYLHASLSPNRMTQSLDCTARRSASSIPVHRDPRTGRRDRCFVPLSGSPSIIGSKPTITVGSWPTTTCKYSGKVKGSLSL